MYPAYQEIAKTQKNTQAMRSIKYALKAEMDHKWMYNDARELALKGEDIAEQPVSVCIICGHTVIGDVPDKCPVCAAAKEYYKTF